MLPLSLAHRTLLTVGAALAVALAPAASASAATITVPTAPVPGYDDGLLGSPDVFSAAFKQSLALLAFSAAPSGSVQAAKVDAAVDWLVGQQCPDGGWQGYVVKGVACGPHAGTPLEYVSEDSNTTALAVQALVATGHSSDPAVGKATAFLLGLQAADGGFEYAAGFGSDPNSTALVIEALLAAGTDPATLVKGGKTPYDALMASQLGCSAPAAEQGGIEVGFNPGSGNVLATVQAIPALVGQSLPIRPSGPIAAGGTALPCPPPGPATTPAQAADYAATWVAGQLAGNSLLGGPNYSNLNYAVMAFVASGTHATELDQVVDFLRGHVSAAVAGPTGDDVGGLALTALAAVAAGEDPTAFGGSDLITRALRLQYVTPIAPAPQTSSPAASPTSMATTSGPSSSGSPRVIATGGGALPVTGPHTRAEVQLALALLLLGAALVGAARLQAPYRGRHAA